MNPLSWFSGPYALLLKLSLVAVLVGMAYVSGTGDGKKLAIADCDREKLAAVQRAITQANEIAKQDAEIVGNNERTVEVIRTRFRTIRMKEKSYAKANPLPPECVLDDDRLSNINDALANK